MLIDLDSPYARELIADIIVRADKKRSEEPETEYMTFSEARERLGISPDTLTKKLKEQGIKTRRKGKGKVFDRKWFYKLKY